MRAVQGVLVCGVALALLWALGGSAAAVGKPAPTPTPDRWHGPELISVGKRLKGLRNPRDPWSAVGRWHGPNLVDVRLHLSAIRHIKRGFRIRRADSPSVLGGLERGVVAQMNAVRRRHALAALRLSRRLALAAESHSAQMGRRGFFSHSSADGSAFWRRLERYYPSDGYRYWSVGENLIWGSPGLTPVSAVRGWLGSPKHRANMLSSRWREIGVSAVQRTAAPGAFGGRRVTIVTADFGVRLH
jgi:uncharacterized protein YkwD